MIPTFTQFVSEELSPEQKQESESWGALHQDPDSGLEGYHHAREHISHHVIPVGQHRMTVPLEDPHDGAVEPPRHIKSHLGMHGYKITDYRAGKVEDKHGREMKLGKALAAAKAPKHYIDDFNSDASRTSGRLHGNLQVVISRHPHDVAGMSTDRNWTSCMDLNHGSNAHYVKHDVAHGTHVAYLTQKGDHDAKNPIARISMKPYDGTTPEGKDHRILVPEPTHYGNAGGSGSFEHTVAKWAKTTTPAVDHTIYHRNDSLYSDGLATHVANWDSYKKAPAEQLHSLNLEHKKTIIERLGNHEPTMKKLMHDPDQTTRAVVARRSGGSPVADMIHAHLANDESPRVRTNVALAATDHKIKHKLFGEQSPRAQGQMISSTDQHHERQALFNHPGLHPQAAGDYISQTNYAVKHGYQPELGHAESHVAIASHSNPEVRSYAMMSHHIPAREHLIAHEPEGKVKDAMKSIHAMLTPKT